MHSFWRLLFNINHHLYLNLSTYQTHGVLGFWGVHISIGSAKDQNKMKIKISIDDGTMNVASDALKFSLHATLTFLSQLASDGSAVDRGHRHSDGRSIVQIWMSFPARPSPAASLSSAPSSSAVPSPTAAASSSVARTSSSAPSASTARTEPSAPSALSAPCSLAGRGSAQAVAEAGVRLSSRVCLLKGPYAGRPGKVNVSSGKFLSVVLDDGTFVSMVPRTHARLHEG